MTELDDIKAQGDDTYEDVKRLDDGSIAVLARFLYTWGILLDVTRDGYGRRYCFSEYGTAYDQFNALKTADDELVGYTRRIEL